MATKKVKKKTGAKKSSKKSLKKIAVKKAVVKKKKPVAKKKAVFTPGQKVKINSRNQVLKGVIKKINRTKAIVLIDDRRYDVPLTIMEAA